MIGYVVEHNFLQFHEAKLSYFLPYTYIYLLIRSICLCDLYNFGPRLSANSYMAACQGNFTSSGMEIMEYFIIFHNSVGKVNLLRYAFHYCL